MLADIADQCPHEVVGEAADGAQALQGIAAAKPDLVLLDVQMPGLTGLEVAAHLVRLPDETPAVIFVTAYDEFALKAFEVHATDYLLKPVRAERLQQAIGRVAALGAKEGRQRLAATTSSLKAKRRHFSVQERDRVLLVPVEHVRYLKAELKYVTVRTRTGEHLIEESLSSIEQELGDVFIRVHRNALVARQAIIGVERSSAGVDHENDTEKGQESWHVILSDIEETLPISRRQWAAVKALVK
ncbi:MAG: response regulator transcription factor [Paucimonas sp.]|nr:response regulator transcription factor [Paucimonas sp.]